MFQTNDIAGGALKQQYYHLAIIAGGDHACVPCTCSTTTPCLHAWSEKTGVPYTPWLGLGQKKRDTGSARPPCISFTACTVPETNRPGNAWSAWCVVSTTPGTACMQSHCHRTHEWPTHALVGWVTVNAMRHHLRSLVCRGSPCMTGEDQEKFYRTGASIESAGDEMTS